MHQTSRLAERELKAVKGIKDAVSNRVKATIETSWRKEILLEMQESASTLEKTQIEAKKALHAYGFSLLHLLSRWEGKREEEGGREGDGVVGRRRFRIAE